MKALSFIAVVLLVTVLPVGLVLLATASAPDAGQLSIGLLSAGGVMLTLPALMGGALSAQWSVDRSTAEGRRVARGLIWYLVAFFSLGGALTIAGSIVGGAPLYLALAAIAIGAALGPLAYGVGTRVRAASPPAVPSSRQSFEGFDRAFLVRKWRTVALVATITFLIFGALAIWLAGWLGEGAGVLMHYALVMACFAGAIAAFLSSVPIARRMREELGGDLARARTLQRVIGRGRPEELSAPDALIAARYAVLSAQHLPFHITGLVLLYLGLVLQNVVPALSRDEGGDVFNVVVAALLIVTMAVLLPTMWRQWDRARRYAAEHPVVEEAKS